MNLEAEIWKKIDNCIANYQVSNLGRVRKILKYTRKDRKQYRYLKGSIYSNGYIYFKLDNKIRISQHRLLALYFIPNLENKKHVNHIDGNKLNNDLSNLEWATPKENSNHAWRIGLQKKSDYRLRCVIKSNSKMTIDLYTGIIYDSLKEACYATNTNCSKIRVNIFYKNEKRFLYI
jgi:hypothetical protein